jgi:hypothetical protein
MLKAGKMDMNANQNQTRPATLVENSMYFLRDRPEACRQAGWQQVKFVCYTPCPAVVIVRDLREKTLHVLRDELFFPALPRL